MKKNDFKLIVLLLIATSVLGITVPVKAEELPDGSTYEDKCGLVEVEYELSYEEVEALQQAEIQSERISASAEQIKYWNKFGSDYYYNQLSSSEKKIWDALEEACLYYITTSADISGEPGGYVMYVGIERDASLTSGDVFDVMWMFKYSNPQYYFLKNLMTMGYGSSGAYAGIYVYDEFAEGTARATYTNEFTSKLESWIAQVETGIYDEQKVKIAHDIIAKNTEYEPNDFDQSAYSMVCLGETVCAGYASTLQLLLNPVGIEAIEVTSCGHGWNYVKIHDNWYAVDVTWDDGSGSDVYYKYYNKSQTTFESGNDSHEIVERWYGYTPDTKYDSTMSDYYNYYPAYFTSEDYVYFKVNDNTARSNRLVMVVDTLNSADLDDVPVSVSDSGNTYEVLMSSEAKVRSFVKRMYTVALGRNADEAGLAFWTNELVTGNRNGAAVAKGFIMSSEMERLNLSNEEFVVRLYKTFFNRTPSEGDSGKAFWINLLENGVSRAYVFRGFCHSAEFQALCDNYGISRGTITLTENRDKNHNVTMYVFRCYDRTLNRQPDTAGLNFWTGVINNKERTPVDVAGNFVFSSEFKAKNLSNEEYIKVLYRMFFDREADTNGFNFWLTEMNSGRRDRYKVFSQFANSAEFKAVLGTFSLN